MSLQTVIELIDQLTPDEKQQLRQYLNSGDYYSEANIKARMWERARRYWREVGDETRLALTDEELDEQFWFFDKGGIPRLKSDPVDPPPRNPLLDMADHAHKMGYRSGQMDISANFKDEIATARDEEYRAD